MLFNLEKIFEWQPALLDLSSLQGHDILPNMLKYADLQSTI